MLGPLLSKILEKVRTAKAATFEDIKQAKQGYDIDEEDLHKVEEELTKVSSVASYVMEISGQLVTNYGPEINDFVGQYIRNFFAINLENYQDLSESELLDATCFFCDYVEYTCHADQMMMYELALKFIEIFEKTELVDPK